MRSTLRSLTFGLAATLASASMAQYSNWWSITGTVGQCYPGQTVDLTLTDGVNVLITGNFAVDPGTCTFTAIYGIDVNYAEVELTTQCNGMLVSAWDSVGFNFFQDTVYTLLALDCGSGYYDCNNVLNGPAMPGTACDDGNPATGPDIWSSACTCIGPDTGYWDCLQIWNGPNLPGSPCVNFLGDTGVWSVQCMCQTNSNVYDCTGVLNGPNMPGTVCDDNNPSTANSFWNSACVCVGDTGYYDCLQEWNGPNLPGTPCTAFGMVGTWSAQCVCETNNPAPCQADFWVIQAYGSDSLPVPYELWLWNLSSGGTGNFTFNWNFGDGTSSTDPYPSHTYAGNGPYNLCLSIADNSGCASMHCDSISIDGDGLYNGMIGEGGDRSEGFTLNVQHPQANGVEELSAINEIVAWPNPVVGELNVAMVSGIRGATDVTITDLNGRVVRSERRVLAHGRNQMSFSTEGLGAGMYMLRIGNSLSLRFVKTN